MKVETHFPTTVFSYIFGVCRTLSYLFVESVFIIFFYSVKENGSRRMNLHFTFSVREISEIEDDEQTLRIPMYLSVEWEVTRNFLLVDQTN